MSFRVKARRSSRRSKMTKWLRSPCILTKGRSARAEVSPKACFLTVMDRSVLLGSEFQPDRRSIQPEIGKEVWSGVGHLPGRIGCQRDRIGGAHDVLLVQDAR